MAKSEKRTAWGKTCRQVRTFVIGSITSEAAMMPVSRFGHRAPHAHVSERRLRRGQMKLDRRGMLGSVADGIGLPPQRKG